MYKIRVILDVNEDVIRTVLVANSLHLEELHFIISKAFGFKGNEMASFYKTDDKWTQGEEIPLFNMAETGEGISMASCFLKNTLPNKNDKLIYVYDFFNLWTFFVEVIDIFDDFSNESPKIILSVGKIPEKAPKKEFKADDFSLDDDDFNDEFDDFNFNEY